MLQIAEILRKYRKDKGLTQQAMADLVGVKRSTYANWEQETIPDLADMRTISKLTDISIDHLANMVGSQLAEPEGEYIVENKNSLPMSLLQTMVENTTTLALANADLAKANLSLSESNSIQSKLLELRLMPVGGGLENPLVHEPSGPEVLAKIIEGGIGKYWDSRNEGRAIVGNWLLNDPSLDGKQSIRKNADNAGKKE